MQTEPVSLLALNGRISKITARTHCDGDFNTACLVLIEVIKLFVVCSEGILNYKIRANEQLKNKKKQKHPLIITN